MEIILASKSPRRRALLEALGVPVRVVPSNAEEHFDGSPEAMVIDNAELKRDGVADRSDGDACVLAADTLVFLEGEALGKPESLDEARAMLRRLSGNTHEVITGVAAINLKTGEKAAGAETTRVTFRELSEREIDYFVETVKPLDRAGAYTSEGPGSLLIARYDGCFQNVLGLPIARTHALLQSIGMDLLSLAKPESARFL